MTGNANRRRQIWIPVLLAVITVGLFWPVRHHAFVNFDDHEYLYDNLQVRDGLSLDGLAWALTTGHASNWHPLTWLSHMLDCQLFGLHPGAHHLVNVAFHALNTVLLFIWLRQMTGAVLRSALVAALFAWHPLHVESVAWASERKDVLCALFWFLAGMAYVKYVRDHRRAFRHLSLVLFGLGLMAKPMLVTFPFTLLLLDVWPLGRIPGGNAGISEAAEGGSGGGNWRTAWTPLIAEKIPFFLLAFLSCAVTYLVQSRGGAVSSVQAISPTLRLENAALAYVRYLGKTIWPVDLAAIYPYPRAWPMLWVLAALAVLGAISVFALTRARRQPFLLIGWCWFLGTLVPTIGLVQVGAQSMADRYMYLPAVGIFIALAWGASEFRLAGQRIGPAVLAGFGGAVLLACLLLTRRQLATWRDSETLFGHALQVTHDNYIALDGLGSVLDESGRFDEALRLFEASVRLEPRYPEAQYDLGTALLRRGELDAAAARFRKAIADSPKFANAYSNLGKTLMELGDLAAAEIQFTNVVRLQPWNAETHFNLATLHIAQGRLNEAVQNFSAALTLNPNYAKAHGNLGVTLMRLGQVEAGARHLAEVVKLEPENPEALFNLGLARMDLGFADEAQKLFGQALALKPGEAKYRWRLGTALARQRKYAEAAPQLRAALTVKPDQPEILNELAWLLATCPDAAVRQGAEAVSLAERACDLTQRERPVVLLTLAAAQAEAGKFDAATASVALARSLAEKAGQQALLAQAASMLTNFATSQPIRD